MAYIDYNFALLPVFFGMFTLLWYLRKEDTQGLVLVSNFLLLTFSLAIFFSASKRGIFVLILVVVLLLIIRLPILKKHTLLVSKLAKNTRIYFILGSILSILFFTYLSILSPAGKNKVLDHLGSKNVTVAKKKISMSVFKYAMMLNLDSSYELIYKKMWYSKADSLDNSILWESISRRVEFPLSGKNLEIIPDFSTKKGFVLDYTSFTDFYYGYARSATQLFVVDLNDNEKFKISVYCYVSNDFEGEDLYLRAEGGTYGNTITSYDLNRKGEWQQLILYGICFKGQATVDLIFADNDLKEYNKFKGYLIFADPTFSTSEYVFSPEDPDTGWGTNLHTTVFPLKGNNVEIVPPNAKGYLLDSLTNRSMIWGGNCYSLTRPINNINVSAGDSVFASVFCFVSADYNGSWVTTELVNERGELLGTGEYTLYYRNSWQKIDIKIKARDEKISFKLWFNQAGVSDFSQLNGHVIWAYPQLKILRNGIFLDPINKENSHKFKSSMGIKKTEYLTILDENSYDLNFLLSETKTNNVSKFEKISRTSLFDMSLLFKNEDDINRCSEFSENMKNFFYSDVDPIRNFVSKTIREDTAYYGFKSNLVLDSAYYGIGGRSLRWLFALKIYSQEYSIREKIMGGGFKFLNWYGFVFLKEKRLNDHPHNPFLHVLLYSGLIGLMLYIILMYKVFRFYFTRFREYSILSMCFFITFFFTFFSGGTPLDPPMMGLLILIPFVIQIIDQK
jgi:hypothetical protein